MKKEKNQINYILDKKDKKIIYFLEKNARYNNSQIAKKVGLSKQVVNYRIKNLEKEGIIKGYWTIIDYQKIGFNCNNILLKLKNMDPIKEKEFIKYLLSIDGISWIAQTLGKWDLMIAFLYENLADFNEIFIKICDKFYENIQLYQILPNLDNYPLTGKLIYKDLKLNEIPTVKCGENKLIKITKNDFLILNELTNNARIPLVSLASKLNISFKTLKFRMEQLKKQGVIQAYRAEINYGKLGYQWRICFLDVHNFNLNNKNKFINYAKKHPNVIYIVNTISSNLNIDILTKNENDFFEIKNEFHREFNDFIKSFEIVNLLNVYKRDFLPKKKEFIKNVN